jgi:hypothetical protein
MSIRIFNRGSWEPSCGPMTEAERNLAAVIASTTHQAGKGRRGIKKAVRRAIELKRKTERQRASHGWSEPGAL